MAEAGASEIKLGIADPKMPQTWQDWTRLNLERKVLPKTVYETLRKNGFGIGSIREAMGQQYPNVILNQYSCDGSGRTADYKALANCKITRCDNPNIRRLPTDKAQVYMWDNFLSAAECDELMGLINSSLVDSTITTQGDGEYQSFRTSRTCYLSQIKRPIVTELEDRISEGLGVSSAWSELNQGQKYEVGQEFKAHTDYFEPGSDEYKENCLTRGQRSWTFMIYLNAVEVGGATRFRMLDHSFQPEQGQAVIWNSITPQGDPNPYTLHHGTKVAQGEKFVITKWFRDAGKGPMLTA